MSGQRKNNDRVVAVSRENNSVITDRERIEAIGDLVREVYQSWLLRGQKFEEAQESAGGDLGIPARRVKAFMSGEVYSVPADQADAIEAGHFAALRTLRDWHINRAERIAKRIAAMAPVRERDTLETLALACGNRR